MSQPCGPDSRSHLNVAVPAGGDGAGPRGGSGPVPVLAGRLVPSMALRRVLGLGAALGRRSCCSQVGPGGDTGSPVGMEGQGPWHGWGSWAPRAGPSCPCPDRGVTPAAAPAAP